MNTNRQSRKIVQIKPGSRYDVEPHDLCNPVDMKGTIIGFDPEDDDLYLHVKWDNGFTNWYSLGDLYEV